MKHRASVQAYHWFAWYWMARGEFDSAIVAMKQARTYDPLSLVITAQSGMPHFYARDFDAAIHYPRAALTLDPHSASGHWELGRARWGKGEYDLGAAAMEETVNLAPNPIALAELGLVYGLAGRTSEAREVRSQIQALSREQYIPAISNAWVHIGLGENDVALEWLERAYDERYIFLHFLPYDPRYDTIRSLPGFENLLRRVQWTREQAASAPAF